MRATVFDVQRFSVHDGPGIRTTVFFKGCPLRCRWCHNPEGLLTERQLQFFEEKCIGCGACGKRSALSDADNCPAAALKVCGREVTVEQVLKEVLKDKVFYGPDGGITLSGGECLLQADFAAALLEAAKEEGLHTAVDTCGCVPWASIEKTLPFCDLYLYDIKCVDPALHKAYTGADNALILANARRLSEMGKRMWIRVPVIPGFNDSAAEMTAIAQVAAALKSGEQVTLMPYHTLGASKYATLGMESPMDTGLRITETQLQTFGRILKEHGLQVE